MRRWFVAGAGSRDWGVAESGAIAAGCLCVGARGLAGARVVAQRGHACVCKHGGGRRWMLWVMGILLSCGAGRMMRMWRIENALRFTKIKKDEADGDVHGRKDLKDRGDDRSDDVGR